MRWLYRSVTGKSPLQSRFEFALWTREMIRVLLREQFDLKLSVASVGRLPFDFLLEYDSREFQSWPLRLSTQVSERPHIDCLQPVVSVLLSEHFGRFLDVYKLNAGLPAP
jgi:hypothetical protein